MLLPAKMKRVEIIVHKDYFDPVMRYLRDARLVELLDVKNMLKGYKGAVSSCGTSERLYGLVAISSKIAALTALMSSGGEIEPAQVGASLTDEQIREIENRISALEQETSALSSEMQVCDKVTLFADTDLGASVREMLGITDVNSPEGRHRLEEIMSRIFDGLRPPELEQVERLGDSIERKDVAESIRRVISDQVADALVARKGEGAVIKVLSQALDLKIAEGSTSKNLRFLPDSWIEKTRERERKLKAKTEDLMSRNAEWLRVNGELVDAERIVEEAKGLCGKTESTYVLEGWLPANRMKELQIALNDVSKGHCIVQDWSGKGSPTMLRNPQWTGVFERLTVGFGTPASGELDPTILWLVTYPLFFGLMFGDVGHGLIFVLLSIGLFFAKRKGTHFQEQSIAGLGGLFNMILDGSGLLILGGVAATVCGFLYGTVMGSEEWFRQLTGLGGALWFDPFTHPITLVKVSITIGVIHVTSGLVLDIVNKVKNRRYEELVGGPVLWLWFYLTFGYLILAHGFRLMTYAFSNLPTVLLLLGLPSGLMLAAKVRYAGPFEGVGEWMESMLASISHTISYIRIMAMKMIHDVFSRLFLGILLGTSIFIGAPIFVALTLLMIIILEGAFVFLQDLRLHWVEWFLKFYAGSGTAFKPFGLERKHTKVSLPALRPIPQTIAG
jgi:V/A-type H+-transporting ATPase subunit I